jgi:hypothetical protein
MRPALWLLAGVSLFPTVALAASEDGGPPPLETVLLRGFPFIRQRPDFCGEADVAMAMQRLGHPISQDQVFAASGVDPSLGRGAYTNELAGALRRLGVEPGPVWYPIRPERSERGVAAELAALHADLVAGQPSIVCMHYADEPRTSEHFRLVTGYDASTDEIVYQEPAEDDGAGRRMKRALFLKLWTMKPRADHWNLIRFRIPPPARAPELPVETPPTAADVAQHAMELREKLLSPGMTVVFEKPFLVVGNESAAAVRDRARNLVRWTKKLLLADFFSEPPTMLEEVWILKDKASYEKTSRELFDTTPDTPYGYYLSSRQALVMNIKPGYGTLTHELVHPFFQHAFRGLKEGPPAWLNEGLASLFERPAERDGHLIGKVNWRLPGLQAALRRHAVPSFRALTHFTTEQFYNDDDGVHYAEARYLCYWLQERGVLASFVRRALAEQEQDATGWAALGEVLEAEPDSLRGEWESFVKKLADS